MCIDKYLHLGVCVLKLCWIKAFHTCHFHLCFVYIHSWTQSLPRAHILTLLSRCLDHSSSYPVGRGDCKQKSGVCLRASKEISKDGFCWLSDCCSLDTLASYTPKAGHICLPFLDSPSGTKRSQGCPDDFTFLWHLLFWTALCCQVALCKGSHRTLRANCGICYTFCLLEFICVRKGRGSYRKVSDDRTGGMCSLHTRGAIHQPSPRRTSGLLFCRNSVEARWQNRSTCPADASPLSVCLHWTLMKSAAFLVWTYGPSLKDSFLIIVAGVEASH